MQSTPSLRGREPRRPHSQDRRTSDAAGFLPRYSGASRRSATLKNARPHGGVSSRSTQYVTLLDIIQTVRAVVSTLARHITCATKQRKGYCSLNGVWVRLPCHTDVSRRERHFIDMGLALQARSAATRGWGGRPLMAPTA